MEGHNTVGGQQKINEFMVNKNVTVVISTADRSHAECTVLPMF
jgi:hypothetical protein